MKRFLLLSLICVHFVIGQEYDEGFIAKEFRHIGHFQQEDFNQLSQYHDTRVFYKAILDAIKPNDFDKEIAEQFYEHIEQCAATIKIDTIYKTYEKRFIAYEQKTKESKEDVKNSLNALLTKPGESFITIYYEIAPESPLYEGLKEEYKKARAENWYSYTPFWITQNTVCKKSNDFNYACHSTFSVDDYKKIVEDFEKNNNQKKLSPSCAVVGHKENVDKNFIPTINSSEIGFRGGPYSSANNMLKKELDQFAKKAVQQFYYQNEHDYIEQNYNREKNDEEHFVVLYYAVKPESPLYEEIKEKGNQPRDKDESIWREAYNFANADDKDYEKQIEPGSRTCCYNSTNQKSYKCKSYLTIDEYNALIKELEKNKQ